jgi:hypothetical protein
MDCPELKYMNSLLCIFWKAERNWRIAISKVMYWSNIIRYYSKDHAILSCHSENEYIYTTIWNSSIDTELPGYWKWLYILPYESHLLIQSYICEIIQCYSAIIETGIRKRDVH